MTAIEQRGHRVALFASVVLLANTAFMLVIGMAVFQYAWPHRSAMQYLFAESYLPLAIYFMWAMGVAGAVAALGAIVSFNFRERWFWRILIIASLTWLAFPPVHTLIGLFALILLIANRRMFPTHKTQVSQA